MNKMTNFNQTAIVEAINISRSISLMLLRLETAFDIEVGKKNIVLNWSISSHSASVADPVIDAIYAEYGFSNLKEAHDVITNALQFITEANAAIDTSSVSEIPANRLSNTIISALEKEYERLSRQYVSFKL